MHYTCSMMIAAMAALLPVAASSAPAHNTGGPALPMTSDPNVSAATPAGPQFPQAHQKYGFMDPVPLEPLPDDVYYTVSSRGSVLRQASMWGVPANVIMTLNPGLTPETMLEPGTKLHVESRHSSSPVPYSRGKCSRGKITNARLMPEGRGYFLRSTRPHSWGVDTTVQALVTLFKAYHEKFPDAAPINVGDLSRRRGGKIKPHKSHQSGRDVDLGFAHTTGPDARHPEHFVRASVDNFDAEKSWFIVETLVRTGLVDVIYVDRVVMKYLWQHASKTLSPEQRERFFSSPRHPKSSSAVLQHWPGHRNHFHVRFACPEGQPGCRD